jgi:hypothetical protein
MHLQKSVDLCRSIPGNIFNIVPGNGARNVGVSEVTPGLLAGAEPDAHQFIVTICLKGDQMEENSEQHRVNSETRPGMHERVRS